VQFPSAVFDTPPGWALFTPRVTGAVISAHPGKLGNLILHGPPGFRKFARPLFNHHGRSVVPLAKEMKLVFTHGDEPPRGRVQAVISPLAHPFIDPAKDEHE
jgi:hypothetical protein